MPVCGQCGQENPEGARFCNACAAPLAGGPAEVRKTVTVLFCDLVGSTSLGERTDPERLRELMGGYHSELRAIRVVAGGEALLAPSVTLRLIAEFASWPEPRQLPALDLTDLTEGEK